MMREAGRLRAALVLLLLVSAALFATGAIVERHQHTEAAPSTSETSTPTVGTSSEAGGEGQHTETHPAPGETAATSSETLFGINPEAPWVVVLGVAASVLLAFAVWFRNRRSVLILVVLFGLLLTTLDVRETVHQVNESRTSLIVVSVVLAVLHLSAAGIAPVLLRHRVSAHVAA